jgi:Zn-dependent protease with chaperone function
MVATGLEAIYKRHLLGVLWLALGGVVAFVGTLRLRLAGGLKLQRVKSGELYKRAFAMAKEMRTPLKRVYVVPAGRGHLTNAYGLSESIAITDNYGKFLNRAELDFVIGHELGHVLGKHGRKGILVMISGFATVALACFFFPAFLTGLRPVFDVAAILGPILIFYFFSRRFEYAADRTSVEFTRDAKAAINALTNLYGFTQAPTRCDPVTELFMTHPSLAHRITAIGRISSTGPDRPFNSIPSR